MEKFLKFTIKTLSTTLMLACVFAAILTYSFAYDLPEHVKVGLRYGITAVNLAAIEADQGLQFGTLEGETFSLISDLQGIKSISAKVQDGKLVISDLNGTILERVEANVVCYLIASNSADGGIIKFNNAPYRGGIALQQDSAGKITVINRLGLEDYLYGVLHQEMSQSNPLEALKAQAIAARNFTVVRMRTHAKEGFDVCPNTHCQVYKGYGGEYIKTNQAVDETRNILMYCEETLVQAYYHKNSGGHTENSENVWFAALPYLRGVSDPYSPVYPWSANFSAATMQSLLSAGGYNMGVVQTISINERTEADGVLRLEIKGEQGNVILEKEKIRSLLGATLIKSLNFQVINPSEQSVSLQSANQLENKSGEITILSSDGNMNQISVSDVYVSDGNETNRLQGRQVSQDGFTFSGFGYGHRLGMSQDGAIAMANQRLGYEDILKFYYSNIEIK